MKLVKSLLILSISVQLSCVERPVEPATNPNIITPNLEVSEESDLNSISHEHLYMISYLATRVIIEDEEARNYFKEAMVASESDHFNLSEILGNNMLDMNPFEEAFYAQFQKYNYEIIDEAQFLIGDSIVVYIPPEGEDQPSARPPKGELHPPGEDCMPDKIVTTTVLVTTYPALLDLICIENSLGFFFPNIEILGTAVNLEDHASVIRTTWHPLNNDDGNAGMELNENGGTCLFIDKAVVEEPIFVMVLRPVNTADCNYGNIDFTAFLAN